MNRPVSSSDVDEPNLEKRCLTCGSPHGVGSHTPVTFLRGVASTLLPCEPAIARDMLHKEPAGAALDELNAESIQTAKLSFGRSDERYFPSAVHVGEKL